MTFPDEPGTKWSAQQFEDRLQDIGQQWRVLLRSAPPPADIPVDVRAELQEKLYDLSVSLMGESLDAVTVEGEHDPPAGSFQVMQEVVARFLLRDVSVDGVEVIDRWLTAALEADAKLADKVVELTVTGEEEESGTEDSSSPTKS